MRKTKRVIAVHDISCVGRCSLTVALPVLSAAGLECSVLPTAILSTHTGGFTGYTCRDLTRDFLPILDHWDSLNLAAEAVYTGFLGSEAQLGLVRELFSRYRPKGARIIIDPVMGDDGRLYPVFSPSFPAGMRALCAEGDVIVPNITEAALLLDIPYNPGPHTKEEIRGMLRGLAGLGPSGAVLTGVQFNGEMGVAVCERGTGDVSFFMKEKIPGFFHGTGDVYASSLTGALLNGFSLADAARIAVAYTVDCIRRAYEDGVDPRYGVDFEAGLAGYMEMLKK